MCRCDTYRAAIDRELHGARAARADGLSAPRYLDVARKALDDIRTPSGVNTPERLAAATVDFLALSEEDLAAQLPITNGCSHTCPADALFMEESLARRTPKAPTPTDAVYVYRCVYCRKTFNRHSMASSLNAHKNPQGNPCSGRMGTLRSHNVILLVRLCQIVENVREMAVSHFVRRRDRWCEKDPTIRESRLIPAETTRTI